MFKFALLLGRMGFFKHEGLRGFQPHWWPMARVQYPEGFSVPMAVGNAVDYAAMFNGKVVPCARRGRPGGKE